MVKARSSRKGFSDPKKVQELQVHGNLVISALRSPEEVAPVTRDTRKTVKDDAKYIRHTPSSSPEVPSQASSPLSPSF
ncbi:hypothetical protein P7K49_009261 [Saguinus oedipus]|uniref:Uncharacterized protein n=1 Tax=Saguinus oedipus TaxID=9490 RepID=A0ABQ9VK83_SAGOE|nr:hypothetical protein P7K49_009261 [Saguinus oedipus]